MTTRATGVVLQLRDPAKTTPLKQAQITGMSFSVELRTLDLSVVRYDPIGKVMIPLNNYPVIIRLLTSNQADVLSTNGAGRLNTVFPDASIEIRLDPAAAPVGHAAILNYSVRTQKKNVITVVFIPDSMRRYYPLLQFA